MVAAKLTRSLTINRILLGASALLVLAALFTIWLGGMTRPYIDKDFLYSADIVTAANTYDEANHRYLGDRYSKGVVSYELHAYGNGTAAIQSTLILRQVNGDPVAKIVQKRDVDTKNGTYMPTVTDQVAKQYLFAPRDLRVGQGFLYHHAAYSTPAAMQYSGREILYGVEVYHYVAAFPNTPLQESYITPTAVPAGQAVGIVPKLEIWVEPSTGWMVKFKDEGQVVRFNKQTRAVTDQIERFNTNYTEASVQQHITYAESLKYRQTFARNIVPTILGYTVVCLALIYMARRARGALPIRILTVLIMAVSAIVAFGWIFRLRPLMSVFVGHGVMHPLSAFCFVLVALCILLIHWQSRRWLAITLSLVITGVGIVGLLSGSHLTDSTLDVVLHQSTIQTVDLYQSSQMSALTAATFVLLGLSIFKISLSARPLAVRFASFGFGVVTALGVSALIMQLLQADQPLAINFVGPLSAATSLLFVLSGYALLVAARELRGTSTAFRPISRRILQPALLCMPLLLIGLFAQFRQNAIQSQLESLFVADVTSIGSQLHNQVELYENTLDGARALYASSRAVDAQEWHTFISAYDLSTQFPGIYSIGFVKSLQPADVSSFTSSQKAQGYASYAIFPNSNRQTLAPVVYIEPQTSLIQKQLGYDFYTDDVRSGVLDQARDTNNVTLTGKIDLQVSASETKPGVLAIAPVYANGQPVDTLAQRRAALSGYVFATISVEDFIHSLSATQNHQLDYRIYDGTQADAGNVLYDSAAGQSSTDRPAQLSTTETVYILGHPMTIVYQTEPGFSLGGQQERLPGLILVGGSVIYLGGLAAIYLIVTYRQQTMRTLRRISAPKKARPVK